MNKAICAAMVLASAGIASADTYTFDLGGLASDGYFFDVFPTVSHDFGYAGVVTHIDIDVTFTANDPSYASEALVAVDTDLDDSIDGDFDAFVFGAPDASGTFSYADSIDVALASTGLVYVTLFEYYDDAIVPDAVYADGSFVTVTYDVPAPAGAAVLGLGGLVAARRRRA